MQILQQDQILWLRDPYCEFLRKPTTTALSIHPSHSESNTSSHCDGVPLRQLPTLRARFLNRHAGEGCWPKLPGNQLFEDIYIIAQCNVVESARRALTQCAANNLDTICQPVSAREIQYRFPPDGSSAAANGACVINEDGCYDSMSALRS